MLSKSEPAPLRFDLYSQSYKHNPFPTLARLRAAGPVIRVRLPIAGNVWLATTYDAVNELLRDHQRFVRDPVAAGNRFIGTILRWLPARLRPLTSNMLLRDEPDHRRLRGLVDQAFQRHSVEAMRPRLEALADEALDQLAHNAARSSAGVDLIEHFARPFPLAVICELLGLPPEDRPKFTRWAARFVSSSSITGILWGLTGLSQMMRYIRQEFRRQSRHPRDGLMAALIQAEEAGERLSEDELVAMIFLLLAAGHETTLHQIACSVVTLLHHPAQLRELTADWSLAETAMPELLRYVSFAQVAKPRFASADTEFYGQSIRRGQIVFPCLASANTDATHFENPDQLDLHRQPNRHLAFGAGIHYCLGAKLSILETQIALQKLFTRFPNLSLAIPRPQLTYTRRFGTRALTSLPIRW